MSNVHVLKQLHTLPRSTEAIPIPPPVGYQPGTVLRYPALAVILVSIALFCVTTPLLIWLTWQLQAMTTHPLALPLSLEDMLFGWIAMLATAAVHEWIHVAAIRACGYPASCGVAWRQMAAYAGAFGQWQRREHALLVTLAPLVVITAVALPLLGASYRPLVIAAFGALLANTSGAAADLYIGWRLLRLPRKTLIYDVDPSQMLISLPAPHFTYTGG